MKSMILIFIVALGCAREPLSFAGDDDDFNFDSGSDGDNDSDSDSDDIDTETETGTDTDSDNDTGTEIDVDSGTDTDTDTNGDTDSETNTSSDTDTDGDTDIDTGTDSATESDTESDNDTETATETETETSTENSRCPWTCKPIASADTGYACDDNPLEPLVIQNWNFDCDEDEYCCQPIGAGEDGALTEYCLDVGFECRFPTEQQCRNGTVHTEFFCFSSGKQCCEP